MSLELNNEQQLLKQSVERFVEHDYSFDQRKKMLANTTSFNRDIWHGFAELGWLGAGLPEHAGGYGGGPIEQAIICAGLGHAMVLEPFVSTAVIGAHALQLADDKELGAKLLPALVEGQLTMALGYAEAGGRYDLNHVATRASALGNGYTINGTKVAVMDAPSADKLIISARIDGDTRDESGIGLFLIDATAGGLTQQPFRNMDGTSAASLHLQDTPAQLLVGAIDGLQVLEQLVERGIAARCAQAAGAMNHAYEQTLKYVKMREQFGVAIGSFQVIQHRLVDMLIAVRECQAMVLMVANDVSASDTLTRARGASSAKAFVGKRARSVAQEIVQLHGGVGMTEELAIGHFFRYLTQFCSMFGSSAHHMHRYTALCIPTSD